MISDRNRLSLWYRDEKGEDQNEHLFMNSFIRRSETKI
jgi:hypothetical protein